MNASNDQARKYLLKNGYRDLYLKPHKDTRDPKNVEYIHNIDGRYAMTDFYNLFDGFCFDKDGDFVWFQVKTDGWMEREKREKLEQFMSLNHLTCMVINVKKPVKGHRRYGIEIREYSS